MKTKPKEKSIITSVRLTESDLLKGIQVFLLNDQKPTYISDIIKQIYIAGLKATYGNDAEAIIPTKTAISILDTLTRQRIQKPAFNLKVKSNKLSKLKPEEEKAIDVANAELLSSLSLDDKSSGFMILKNLEVTKDITTNLKSPNESIRRITSELFFPIANSLPEKDLIIEVYNSTR